jgi:hypothetical protein
MTHNQYSPSLISEQQATHLQKLDGMSELTDEELAGVTGAFGPHPGWGYGYGYGEGYGYGGGWGHGYGYGEGYGYGGGYGHGYGYGDR